MANEVGSVSSGTTGNHTVSLVGSFTPARIKFWAGARSGTTESSNLSSFGYVDVGNGISTCQTNFSGSIGHQTKNSNSSCLIHYANVSGTLTKVLDVTFVSSASGQFTINIGTANVNYPIYFEATD